MAIRLASNCNNCENISGGSICAVHEVKVNQGYTCDSFEMGTALQNDRDCLNCIRYETDHCSNPQKAAKEMLCSHWAPQNAA